MTEFIVNYKIHIGRSIEELSEQFAKLLIDGVNDCTDYFNIALSGGSTPKRIFEYLASNHNNTINWSKINFFWSDERCVPPNDSESNYKMAYEALLSKLPIPSSNIYRIKGENEPLLEAANYSAEIINHLKNENNFPRFDLIMLGLGEDGHTASIFSNQLNLIKTNEICAVATHPVSNQKRITFTGKLINNAKNIVFIASGKIKSKIVNDILNNKTDSKNYPASFIKPINGNLIWLLDREASILYKENQNWK